MRRAVAIALLAAALVALGADVAAADPDALAPAYVVSLRATNGGFDWSGSETIRFSNPGPDPIQRVWVRLWGNGPSRCHHPRAIRIGNVRGARAGAPQVDCTAVPLDLTAPLAPGARGSVSFDVAIRVPRRPDRFGRGGIGLALLSNALPALSVRENGVWRLDPYFGIGEAWIYPAADWRVRLRGGRGVQVAAPGVAVGGGFRHLADGRDYSFAAGRGLTRTRSTIDGIRVTVWGARNTHERERKLVVKRARKHLHRLAQLFGPYGWPDLQIVLTRATAMEHTALIMAPSLNFVLAHELSHMWWFALVGDDQARSPWLDEGFASYAEGLLAHSVPRCDGPDATSKLMPRGVDYWARNQTRYGIVYFQGACLLQLLERRLGKPRFRAAMRGYVDAHRYGWSTPQAFMDAMNAAVGGPGRLDDLWFDFGLSTR